MSIIKSKIDTASKIFTDNVNAMEKHIADLNKHVERIKQGAVLPQGRDSTRSVSY